MDLLTFIVLLLILSWALGLGFSLGGGLIHLLLVIAVIVILYKVITGKQI